jgi:hypothetical protein
VKNPWLDLDFDSDQYLLDMDRDDIGRFNAGAPLACRVIPESIPEPFIGNPESAKVVLLLLNPGHGESDRKSHRETEFKATLFRNLRHEAQEYPFYPLNPRFSHTGSAKWWQPRTRELGFETGLDPKTLSRRQLAIEWFPYHSQYSALGRSRICPSQEYTFQIAKQMLESKLVIAMRSIKHWAQVDTRFLTVPCLKNPRACYVSRNNMDLGVFQEIVKTLKE